MLGCVMYLEFSVDPSCLFWRESLIERGGFVGVEVVHDKDYLLYLRPAVNHLLDFLSPVNGRPVFSYTDTVPSSERLYHCEDTACAIFDVFRIKFFVTPRFHWQRFPSLTKKLVRFLIHADDWTQRVVRSFIYVQHVFHTGYEFGVFFRWDAPVLVSVGPDFVFLEPWRWHLSRQARLARPWTCRQAASVSTCHILRGQARNAFRDSCPDRVELCTCI